MASISIAGPVVGSPELRYFESGSCVLQFSVADKGYVKPRQGEQYGDDQYYNVEVWNDRAKTLVDMIQKGVIVSVSGQPIWSEYTSRDGQKVKKLTIERPMVDFILTRRQSEALAAAGCGAAPGGGGGYGGGEPSDEEVPF